MVQSVCSDVHDGTTQSEAGSLEKIAPILKSIIVTRSKDGATVDEIIDDYYDFTGESLLTTWRSRDNIGNLLRQIDGIWSTYSEPNGPFLWYCSSDNTRHIAEMIKKQKSPRFHNRRYHQPAQPSFRTPHTSRTTTTKNNVTNAPGPRDKFYPDNMNFIPKRNAWNRTPHRSVASHPYLPPQRRQMQHHMQKPMMQQQYYSNSFYSGPTFCGMQMIGDDFFLSLARWELGFQYDPGHNIQQSGLCISGQTIAEAADRVMKAPYINDRVIINLGVVDILHGNDFVDMQEDLYQLKKNLENRGARAILTTLSPLANSSHIPDISDKLHRFNNLIRRYQWEHIDLWRCFVNERDQTLYECFQPAPRQVTGSNKPHVLWNKLGRQRIIKFMKTQLASLI
nr:oskar [Aedes aegypti]